MVQELPVLEDLRLASPCSAAWNDMRGDDRVRFCGQCRKSVYNFAAMTRAEARALVQEKDGRLCGILYRRPDGTVLTSDCPVGLRLARRGLARLVTAAAAVAASITVFAFGYTGQAASVTRLRFMEPFSRLAGWLNPPPVTPIVAPGNLILGTLQLPPRPNVLIPRSPESSSD